MPVRVKIIWIKVAFSLDATKQEEPHEYDADVKPQSVPTSIGQSARTDKVGCCHPGTTFQSLCLCNHPVREFHIC